MLNLLQRLPFSLQEPEVKENDTNTADKAIEQKGAEEVEAVLDVQIGLGAEEEEDVAASGRDAPRQTSGAEREHLGQEHPGHLPHYAVAEGEDHD